METQEKIQLICEAASDKKAEDIVVMEMGPRSSFCSYFVVMSGSSNVRVKTIADEIEKRLKEEGERIVHREGYQDGVWVLMDCGDVVAHIFLQDTRQFYNLEKLWGDVPRRAYTAAPGGGA